CPHGWAEYSVKGQRDSCFRPETRSAGVRAGSLTERRRDVPRSGSADLVGLPRQDGGGAGQSAGSRAGANGARSSPGPKGNARVCDQFLVMAICLASSISIRGTPSTSFTVPLAAIVLPLKWSAGSAIPASFRLAAPFLVMTTAKFLSSLKSSSASR